MYFGKFNKDILAGYLQLKWHVHHFNLIGGGDTKIILCYLELSNFNWAFVTQMLKLLSTLHTHRIWKVWNKFYH